MPLMAVPLIRSWSSEMRTARSCRADRKNGGKNHQSNVPVSQRVRHCGRRAGGLALGGRSVTGRDIRRMPDPEKINDPKARFKNILSEASIVYTAEVARKIAAAARLDVLATRCPSFRAFQDALVS